jgi:hypothetical protein
MKSRKNKTPDSPELDRKRNDASNKKETGGRNGKLPGEYPAQEDIMNRMNMKRVGMDVENFSRSIGTENFNVKEPVVTDPNSIEDDPLSAEADPENRQSRNSMEYPVTKDMDEDNIDRQDQNDSDVTDEDMQALGPKDLSMDMGEDEQLKNRVWPVDMAGGDLDVPGSELDDANEEIGSEDEENNSYSLGGDAHEDNLEGK